MQTELYCQTHKETLVGMICLNTHCKADAQICHQCLSSHESHMQQCLELEEILKLLPNLKPHADSSKDIRIIYKQMKQTIISQLDTLENTLEAEVKKLETQRIQQFISQPLNLIVQNSKLITYEDEGLYLRISDNASFKESLQDICGFKTKSILLDLERIRQVVANDTITIKRLNSKDHIEQWVHSQQSLTANTIKNHSDQTVYLVGIYQPKMKFEYQDLRFTYRIHPQTDLSKTLYQIETSVDNLEINDDLLYICIEPFRLEPHQSYTLSSQANQKAYSFCYCEPVKYNPYIEFQNSNLSNSQIFTKLEGVADIESMSTSGTFPMLQITLRKE